MTDILDDIAEALQRAGDPYRTAAPAPPEKSRPQPPPKPAHARVTTGEALPLALKYWLGRGFEIRQEDGLSMLRDPRTDGYWITLHRCERDDDGDIVGSCTIRLRVGHRELVASQGDKASLFRRISDRLMRVYGIEEPPRVEKQERPAESFWCSRHGWWDPRADRGRGCLGCAEDLQRNGEVLR